MLAPAESDTRSPGTTSCDRNSVSEPSRMTVAFTWTVASSRSTAVGGAVLLPEAEQAAHQDDRQDDRRHPWGRAAGNDKPAAAIRMRMIGLVNCREQQYGGVGAWGFAEYVRSETSEARGGSFLSEPLRGSFQRRE